MSTRVAVPANLLTWAQERSGHGAHALQRRFPKLPAWIAGIAQPTLKQLERFASATYTPVGYFFLPQPPAEKVPIPDLRTVQDQEVTRPSPNLLDTLYLCQQRQEWYHDFARLTGEAPNSFVGSANLDSDVESTAARMRHALGFDLGERRMMRTWEEALRRFIEQADALGVLVMVNGVVGTNTHRKLNPEEFRGFALSDALAPLVFINGADSKSAQMFTLAHELAHLWLGESAVSNVDPAATLTKGVEGWCNAVAAELLVPLAAFDAAYRKQTPVAEEAQRLARLFKVSTLVILRRMRDAGGLSEAAFWQTYNHESQRIGDLRGGKGGDFYRSQTTRIGKRFARAVVVSTLEGQTLYRDGFRLLGVSKLATFEQMGRRLEVM